MPNRDINGRRGYSTYMMKITWKTEIDLGISLYARFII